MSKCSTSRHVWSYHNVPPSWLVSIRRTGRRWNDRRLIHLAGHQSSLAQWRDERPPRQLAGPSSSWYNPHHQPPIAALQASSHPLSSLNHFPTDGPRRRSSGTTHDAVSTRRTWPPTIGRGHVTSVTSIVLLSVLCWTLIPMKRLRTNRRNAKEQRPHTLPTDYLLNYLALTAEEYKMQSDTADYAPGGTRWWTQPTDVSWRPTGAAI